MKLLQQPQNLVSELKHSAPERVFSLLVAIFLIFSETDNECLMTQFKLWWDLLALFLTR